VFPAPVRAVLAAGDYEQACALSRAACGKAVSRQLFNILDKIREVDALLSPALQQRLVEACPELSFAVLKGAPMTFSKATAAGRAERTGVLGAVFADVGAHMSSPPPGARTDDVLDAFALAWTARRYTSGSHLHLGGELDETGLRMEMVA
jgi:predicted RNase H-like nuclease